jgi:hypothetical protein
MKPDLLTTSAVVRSDFQHALVQQDPELDGVEGLTLLGCEQVELEPTFLNCLSSSLTKKPQKARAFVLGNPFQPSLMFVVKTGA